MTAEGVIGGNGFPVDSRAALLPTPLLACMIDIYKVKDEDDDDDDVDIENF